MRIFLWLMLVVTTIVFLWTIFGEQGGGKSQSPPLRLTVAASALSSLTAPQKKLALKATNRSLLLEQLKTRWLALREDDRQGRAALIKESVKLLYCTAEFVMLGEYLGVIEKDHFFIKVKSEAEKRFSQGDSNEARAALLRMVKELRDFGVPSGVNKTDLNSQIELWCFEAGKNCPPAEFQSFCDALDDEDFIQQATFGRDLARVTTDPKGAVASTMALLQHDITTIQSHQFLSILLTNLPEGSNYAAFEQMLPPDQGNYRYDLKGARAALLSEWAAHDITAAANYVVAHPERIVPENMESVVTGYIVKDMAAGLEWIQTFPEGPWFDHAARVASDWIAEIHPNKARELALQIQDKDIRKECVRNAEHYLSLQKK